MRLRHIKGAEEEIANSPYVIQDPKAVKGKWRQLFGNPNPIRIEIGMGKGKFIMELAAQNPDVNYVGIERYSSVLLRGTAEAGSSWSFLIFILSGWTPWSWRRYLKRERSNGSI